MLAIVVAITITNCLIITVIANPLKSLASELKRFNDREQEDFERRMRQMYSKVSKE